MEQALVSGVDATSASASASENNTSAPQLGTTQPPTPAPAPTSTPKSRSCVVCRSRKVRCDKQVPCSNCRRGNVACVYPSADRPPKWSRHFKRNSSDALEGHASPSQTPKRGSAKVMDRVRNLENLVRELRAQLEQAQEAATSADSQSETNSPGRSSHDYEPEQQREASPVTNIGNVQKQLGRLVLQDPSRSRYVSSGFWSRVNDEVSGPLAFHSIPMNSAVTNLLQLDALKMETRGLQEEEDDDSDNGESPEQSPPTYEARRPSSERHAFLFRHNLSPPVHDLHEFRPLPSQILFLVDVFNENVNFFCMAVHIPSLVKMVRDLRGNDMTGLTPAHEALLFSIYYAAVTSMEEDDVSLPCSLKCMNCSTHKLPDS